MSFLPKVQLLPAQHREQRVICILFDSEHTTIDRIVRTLPNRKWSQSMRCWYLPATRDCAGLVYKHLKHIAFVDYSLLKAETSVAANAESVAVLEKNLWCICKPTNSKL